MTRDVSVIADKKTESSNFSTQINLLVHWIKTLNLFNDSVSRKVNNIIGYSWRTYDPWVMIEKKVPTVVDVIAYINPKFIKAAM